VCVRAGALGVCELCVPMRVSVRQRLCRLFPPYFV